MQNTTRGPGFWKFSSSFLHDTDYVNLVKEVITETEAINKEASHQLLLDTVKDQIRGNTIRYSSIKKEEAHEKAKRFGRETKCSREYQR